MDWTEFAARIEHIHSNLDNYSYYDLLNVHTQADLSAIRSAYHRMALNMHPDRYHDAPNPELRDKIYRIYKRVAEGYHVLTSTPSRNEYDQNLARGEKRLVKTERKKSGPTRLEDAITDPKAKKFFMMGLNAERSGDLKSAKLNYKFAMDLVGEHPVILTRMDAVKNG